jgi:hypothetical protein
MPGPCVWKLYGKRLFLRAIYPESLEASPRRLKMNGNEEPALEQEHAEIKDRERWRLS